MRHSHSLGLVLIDGAAHPDNKDFSFHVSGGLAVDLHGWGARGITAPDVGANGPQASNFHTVFVDELTAENREAVRGLAEEHKARYQECRVWAFTDDDVFRTWVKAGLVEDVIPGAVVEEPVVEEPGEPGDPWGTSTSGEVEQHAPPAE